MYNVLPHHNEKTTEEEMFEDVEGLILKDKSDGSLWIVSDGFRSPIDDIEEYTEVEHRNILKIPISFD